MTHKIESAAVRAAAELSAAFVRDKRDSGATFWKIRREADSWIPETLGLDLHRAVDGDSPRFPDDWIYETAAHAASTLEDYDDPVDEDLGPELADGLVSVYTADLFTWAAAHSSNRELIAEAEEEYGMPEAGRGIEAQIQAGQYLGCLRIMEHLQQVLRDRIEDMEDDQ